MAMAVHLTGDIETDAQLLMFPKGEPRIYGMELGIPQYPDARDVQAVESAIAAMKNFDSKQNITLFGDKLQRYVDLGTIPTINCEFCCSAKALVNKDGSAACGCAHSYAMRGLMKYIMEYHNDQFTDDEIMQELMRWKAIYFPKQMMKRYMEQAPTSEFTPDMAALLHNTKVKKGAKVNIVPVSEAMKNLPSMAGGC